MLRAATTRTVRLLPKPVRVPIRYPVRSFAALPPRLTAASKHLRATSMELPRSITAALPLGPNYPYKERIDAPPPYIVSATPLEKLQKGYAVKKTSDGTEYAEFVDEIMTSPNDDRAYRLIMLNNGMECMIMSDPKTDKASASMDVRAGHLNDPEDLPGLAHFCEHLMFMGTEKFPKENEYTEYLTQNAGSSNAFTGMDNTCYYFDVHPSALTGALDRFAQFFIAPLFDPSCTEREANAVHSENAKNLQNDMWRMFQLDKSTSSRNHAYWRFGTGNRETLWDGPERAGIDVRARLIEWQEKHYSSNLMKLAVLGKESLDSLTEDVVKLFTPAQNRTLEQPLFVGSPLQEQQLKTIVALKTVKDKRTLDLTFPLPDESPFWATKPGGFLSHLIGHEGEGSILSHLKKRGWANGLSSGAGNGANGFEFFKVQIDLTADGFEHREEVLASVFKYIEIVRAEPPREWVFEEVAQLNRIAFQFKEKSSPMSTAMSMSSQLGKPVPRNMLLASNWLVTRFDAEMIEKVAEHLSPNECRIMIANQKGIEGIEYAEKEEWYGTEYTILPTPAKLLQKQGELPEYSDLALPQPNEFIPTNLDIHGKQDVAEPAKRPLSLLNTPTTRLWYKKDDRWWVPRGAVFFLLRSPLVDDTPLNSVLSRFFTDLVRDSLSEYSYDAELAGLSYSFDSQGDGILVTFEGYNDKLNVLARKVLERMATLKVDPKRFEITKDLLKRGWTNYRLEQPYQHAGFGVTHLTIETMWTPEEKLAILDAVTSDNVQQYITDLTSRLHVELLVHGNILKDEALSFAKLAEATFKFTPLTAEELLSHRALLVPEGKYLLRQPVASLENVNSSLEQLTFLGDVNDPKLRVLTSLFGQMVQDPLFDQLRTKEQLGYIVSGGARKSIGFLGYRVIVQSEREPAYLEARIDAFWESFRATLADMPEEEFEKYKTTVRNKKLEDHKNMWQESSHLWLNIHAGYYDFMQREKDAELVMTITKADMIAFFTDNFFATDDRKIKRLSVHLKSQRLQPDGLAELMPLFAMISGTPPTPEVQAEMMKFAASKPTKAAVVEFAKGYMAQLGVGEAKSTEFLSKIEALLQPTSSPAGVQLIEDVAAWRRDAERGPYAVPVAEYADLFSKL